MKKKWQKPELRKIVADKEASEGVLVETCKDGFVAHGPSGNYCNVSPLCLASHNS